MSREQIPAPSPENWPTRTEVYDVVLLKHGKHDSNATPEDFKRIKVEAVEPLQAMMSDAVNISGYRVICATNPGIMTEPEILARRRMMEGPPVDRSKI